MKAVILAGGSGTRLSPFTKIINKHLLPVGSYPMIYWPLIRLRQAGISNILIVTNEEDIDSFKQILGTGEELGITLTYTIQKEKGKGIANALNCAKDFIEGKFVVLLGDNLFDDDLSPYIDGFKKDMYQAKVLLKKVKDPNRYGVATIDENMHTIKSIIEKPKNSESKYCVTGIYFYDEDVFTLIESLSPSDRGELEITDLNNLFINKKQLNYDILKGWWLDAGTHDALYQANKHYFEEIEPNGGL